MAVKSPRVALVVDAVADLPSVATEGDLALVLSDDSLRTYTGSAWTAVIAAISSAAALSAPVITGGSASGMTVAAPTPVVVSSGTVGSAAADTVRLGSVDRSAGNTILALATEGTGVFAAGTPAASTGAIALSINGTVYFIPASVTAPT